MQMISKNNKGITLIALIVTIIVMLILVSITFNFGIFEFNKIKNQKIESELVIVQEAVMQRFALIKSANQLGIIADSIEEDVDVENDTNRPSQIIGTRIANIETIETLGFEDITFLSNYSSGDDDKKYEEYYYLLDVNDLNELGIKNVRKDDEDDVSARYIINYLTGEVFDITNKKYYQTDNSVYTKPTDVTINEKSYDFNDD